MAVIERNTLEQRTNTNNNILTVNVNDPNNRLNVDSSKMQSIPVRYSNTK